MKTKFANVTVNVNHQSIDLKMVKQKPYVVDEIFIKDRYRLISEKKLDIGDVVEINFNPSGEVQEIDLNTDENEQWLCYIIEKHFVSLEVDTFEDNTLIDNTCVEKNEDGRQSKITFEILNHEWLDGFKRGVGIAWHANDYPGDLQYEARMGAHVDFASGMYVRG